MSGRPLYVLPDDDDDRQPDKPSPGRDRETGKPVPHPFRLMLGILAGPVEGWKAVRRCHISTRATLSGLLYPMTGVAAASCFATLFYDPNATIADIVKQAVTLFMAFFFGYYLILLCARVLPGFGRSGADEENDFDKTFIAFSLSTFILFQTFYQLLPMLEPVLVFLPLWSVYVICRGIRFLRLPAALDTRASIILSALTIGIPVMLIWACGRLLAL